MREIITLSVKEDIGGYVGHTDVNPALLALLEKAEDALARASRKGLIVKATYSSSDGIELNRLFKKFGRLLPRDAVECFHDDFDKIYALTPQGFELLVAELYDSLGFEVTMTKQTNDGGVDIFLEKTINGMMHSYAVQCKHVSKPHRKIGVAYLRELLGTITDKGVTAGILVTNALFTKGALAFVKRHAGRIFAIAKEGLQSLMRECLEITA